MKIIGVIPARFASSRFPGKPLIDLKGKSMIQRVVEGAQKCALFSEIIVATDDQRIADEVNRFGGKVVMTSESHRTGTDRCGEVVENLEADVVVNIQGDEPLVSAKQLEQLCRVFEDPSVQIATLGIAQVTEEDRVNPNRIKLVRDHQENAIYFSRSPIPNDHHADESVKNSFPFLRHIGLYAYRKETLMKLTKLEPTQLEKMESLEQLRWLYYGFPIRVVETDIETPNIDVPADVEKVLDFL